MDSLKQMEAEMKIRNLSRGTQQQYLRVLRLFSDHFGKPAEELEVKDVRSFLLATLDRGLSPSTVKVVIGSLKRPYSGFPRSFPKKSSSRAWARVRGRGLVCCFL